MINSCTFSSHGQFNLLYDTGLFLCFKSQVILVTVVPTFRATVQLNAFWPKKDQNIEPKTS